MDVGTELGGRFVLRARIGQGAMGVVYRADDHLEAQPAAVKVVPLTTDGVRERFVREIRALAAIEDPHVVRYLAHGTRGRDAWLAMEWLQGRDLQSRLDEGRLSLEASLELALRVSRALGEAHARGLVHRDVKPANLFLPDDDPRQVKLLDFGVVQLSDAARATRTGTVLGTPAYMAPEQASARPVDARADVYGLAGVLFACLSGRPPFVGKNPLALLARSVFEVPPRLDALLPELPCALADLVEASLSKDPAARPADGHALAERLAGLDLRSPAGPALTSGFVSTAEIRLVSVVVVQRPHGEDPEAERAAVEAVARPIGGRVARLLDGSWVLFVVGRESATDFGVFSARAALALRRLFWGAPIALATGRVRLDGPEPHGEAVELAVGLLEGARGDVVVTDTLTSELAQEAFRFEPGPSSRSRLLVAARTQSGPVLGRRTPLVGRRRELARVEGLWAYALDEARAQTILFTGLPGLGKSRLVRGALDALRDEAELALVVGQGALQQGEAFSLVGALLAGAAELDTREPVTVRRRRLRSYLEARMDPDAAQDVVRGLGQAAGAPPLRGGEDDPRLAAELARRAAERWLRAERGRGPLLCAIDDVQWADRPSLEAIAAGLGGSGGATLLVLSGRPNAVSVVRAVLGAVDEVALEPLGDKSAARLVTEIAGAEASDAAVEAAVRAGAGNPYYLEELARALASADASLTLPGTEGTGTRSSVPGTVQAMAEARLEGLQPELRRVLRAASVLGGRFPPEGLAALLGDTEGPRLYAQLEQLVSAELLDAEGRGATYRFRHDLLRDAAYGLLTEEDRRAGHRRAAEWHASWDRPEAATVAEHMRLAGLFGPAARWFGRAAERAFAAGDLSGARAHAEAGLQHAEGEVKVDLLRVDAEARLWAGEVPAAAARAAEARAASEARNGAWLRALAVHFQAAGRSGAIEIVQEGLREARALEPRDEDAAWYRLALAHGARELLRAGLGEAAEAVLSTIGDADLGALARAEIESVRAFAAMHRGDHERWCHHLSVALSASESAGHVSQACALRGELGFARAQLGDFDVAWRQLTDAHREAAELGLTHVEQWVLSLLPPVAMELGRAELALDLARRAVQALEPLEDPRLEGCARAYLARALANTGALEAASREAARATLQLEPFKPLSGFAWAVRSEVALAAGDLEGALENAQQACLLREAVGQLEEGDAAAPLSLARALRALGRDAEANAVSAAALQQLEAQAARIADDTARSGFLERPRAHRNLRDLVNSHPEHT